MLMPILELCKHTQDFQIQGGLDHALVSVFGCCLHPKSIHAATL
jgi:hypothetical protein